MRNPIALAALLALAGCSSGHGQDQAPEQPATRLTDGSLGSACGACRKDLICSAGSAIPGGYCTKKCSVTSDCEPEGVCYHVGQMMLCLRGCATDADCRDGYACQGDPGAEVCFPAASAGPPQDDAGAQDATDTQNAAPGGDTTPDGGSTSPGGSDATSDAGAATATPARGGRTPPVSDASTE